MKTILALDLGTKTGFAVAVKKPVGRITSGVKGFKATRFQSADRRYFNFRVWLKWMESAFNPEVIYFEEVRKHIGVDAAHAYGGFKAVLTEWCIARDISFEGVPVGTIKKFITGTGRANKDMVIEAVKKLGHFPEDDNEADALALLYYAVKNEAKAIDT